MKVQLYIIINKYLIVRKIRVREDSCIRKVIHWKQVIIILLMNLMKISMNHLEQNTLNKQDFRIRCFKTMKK